MPEGEVLRLGPRELTITVDPQRTSSPFAMGTQTLPPGTNLHSHRFLNHEHVLFVYKGQGRATVESKAITLIPGVMMYVPRTAWHTIRNTGTGTLRLLWVGAPAGIEQYYRDYASLGPSPDPAALNQLAQRYGLEFREDERPANVSPPAGTSQHGRRRPHRGGRGRGGGQRRPQASPPTPQPPPPTPASTVPLQQSTAPPAKPRPVLRPARHRRGRVKEVYMGGRWVQVSGEGPVIDAG